MVLRQPVERLAVEAQQQLVPGDLAGARRSVLGSLEIAPGYPDAQELLLTIIGGNEENP